MLLQIAASCRQVDASVGRQLLHTALRACQRHVVADHYRSFNTSAADQGKRTDQQHEQQPHSSWREKLIVLSNLTLCAQGHVQQLVSTSLGRAATAATSVAAAATAAAGAPAGVSLAFFQIQNERPQHYWLRQAGLADRNVTHGLVAAIVGCFGLQMISPGFTRFCVRAAPLVADGEYWRLLTAAFLHGNIVHCGINAFALWNIGRVIEGELGSKAFTAVYLGSAIAGNLTSQLLGSPFMSSLGASGALYGIMGGWVAYRMKNQTAYGPLLRSPEMISIGGTLAINAALMLAFHATFDIWAHVGGFVGGAVISALISPRYGRW